MDMKSLGLILCSFVLLVACSKQINQSRLGTQKFPEEGSTAAIALDSWLRDKKIKSHPKYEDYLHLLLKRSKRKPGKGIKESPRELLKKENKNDKPNKIKLATQNASQPLIMAHYMPWFQSLDVSGYWGIHWTMNNCDPNTIDASGRREICAHHYPLIGPYDTSDPDLHEYHALLMHLSGIDGVIIDWYGVHDAFDWPIIRQATETLIDALDKYDLQYAIMYEDKTIEAALNFGLIQDGIATAILDLQYLEDKFFSRENYLHFNNQPVLLNFGPVHFTDAAQWQQLFSALSVSPIYQGLWEIPGLSQAFVSWIYNDELFLPWFYQTAQNESWELTIGEAYPMFDDYYFEGGWGDNLFEIDNQNGTLFMQTLQQAAAEGVDIIQLNTWNDFGEGTDIEPSVENMYQYLLDLQAYTGVDFDQDDLEAATEFYFLRKELGNAGLQRMQNISQALKQGRAEEARALMKSFR